MKNLLNKLNRAHTRLRDLERQMEEDLQPKVIFTNYSVFFQMSDGCFMLEYNAQNAPLEVCLEIINKKGVLYLDDFLSVCL